MHKDGRGAAAGLTAKDSKLTKMPMMATMLMILPSTAARQIGGSIFELPGVEDSSTVRPWWWVPGVSRVFY
jgi:hypothetical protein